MVDSPFRTSGSRRYARNSHHHHIITDDSQAALGDARQNRSIHPSIYPSIPNHQPKSIDQRAPQSAINTLTNILEKKTPPKSTHSLTRSLSPQPQKAPNPCQEATHTSQPSHTKTHSTLLSAGIIPISKMKEFSEQNDPSFQPDNPTQPNVMQCNAMQ